jgi:(p)ppGpp synthase/HD superfamily hydrolase
MNNVPKLVKAFELAEFLHRNQYRKRGVDEMDAKQIPYLTHLTEVLALAILGGADEDQQIAALLHDAIEDQPTMADGRETDEVIGELFGQRALEFVLACTDGKPGENRDANTWRSRKEHHIAELDAMAATDASVLLVSIADKLSNSQAIVADVTQHGPIVWKRFNATPNEILWYYNSMLALFTKYLDPSHTLLHRFKKVVAEMQQIV